MPLFSSPSQYSSLFTAIENDYLALVVKGKDGSGGGASNDDTHDASLRDLKRLTSKSKRFGFQMVNILAECFTTICRISSHCRPICSTLASASASLFRWQRKRVIIRGDLATHSLRMPEAGRVIAHLTSQVHAAHRNLISGYFREAYVKSSLGSLPPQRIGSGCRVFMGL